MILILLLFLLIILHKFIYSFDFFKDTNKYNINYKEKYNIIEYNNLNSVGKINDHEIINQNYKTNNPEFVKLQKINNLDNFNNFILILDFPYFGGGTTFFLNTILSKYKDNQNFLIVRNFNKNIHFYINDEYKLKNIYFENDAIKLLHLNKNKIKKIFINSIIGHSKIFIDNILLLNSDVTSITHDYSLLYDNWQPSNFNNLFDNYTIVNSNINIINIKNLITQDINNLPIYDKYLEKGKQIIISPLPDYQNKFNKINTNNSKIVVGVVGNISNIKGRELIVELINNNLYDVYIFGNLFVDYDKQYSYKNINEFNDLLVKIKPNIWIEATKWPETYSYCLSLMFITNLPILYLYKDFISVIENRLINYEKAIVFNNIKQLIDNKIIEKNVQNYFYTIEPMIYYNEFWETYFGSNNNITINIDKKNIVLMTSKIIVSNEKLIYTEKRSIYSVNERFLQTINTIESIRKYIPNSYIILIDNSQLDDNMIIKLKEKTDHFINVTNNTELNYYTDVNEYKALGEISQQLFVYNIFLKNLDISKINYFFKISGRYFLNENFNYSIFDNQNNIFKKNNEVTDRNYYYTSFYKLNKNILEFYFSKLKEAMDNKEIYMNDKSDLEVIIPSLLKDKFTTVDNIGLTQIYSVWNKIDYI
jgi:hypothetical protein